MMKIVRSVLIRLAAVLMLMASRSTPAAQVDGGIALKYARHLECTSPPCTTERGMEAQVRVFHDTPELNLRAEARVRWNDAYRHPSYSEEARNAYRYDADWRELYMSTDLAEWNVSLGLQQVVWGKADNLRVVDQVNAVDLRDFVLPDLNDYRKPAWMLRGTRRIADWNVELLYLPRFDPTTFARPGSEYFIPLIDPQLAGNVTLLSEKRPSHQVRNGELGAHVSQTVGGLDLDLFLFHTRDDNPVYRQLWQSDAQGNPSLALQAEYRRQFMAGLAAAYAIGNGIVLRSEFAYVPNFTYMVQAGSDDGLIKSPTLTGLVGVDYLWRDWLLSFQASDRYIADWSNYYFVPEHEPVFTLSATGNMMGGRLESRVALTGYTQHGNGTWLQLKTTWKPDDCWAYTVGADLFNGARQGLFGQFRDKDRLYLEMKYRF